jgi:hypothetical protein
MSLRKALTILIIVAAAQTLAGRVAIASPRSDDPQEEEPLPFSDRHDVDLRGPVLGPNDSQGALGWCFAYAASDMISTAIQTRISPIDAGITYFSQMSDTSRFFRGIVGGRMKLESGEMKGLLKILKHEGACPEQNAAPQLRFLSKDQILTGLKSKQFTADETCTERISIDEVKMRSFGEDDMKIAQLDQSLDRGMAAALDYFVFPLLTPEHRKHHRGLFDSITDRHASSIVARRTRDGVTSYLIRNSWGSSCSQYRADLECEGGNFWITEKELRKRAKTITVVTER